MAILLLNASALVWNSGGVLLGMLMSEKRPTAFSDTAVRSRLFDSMIISYMTLQELLTEHEWPPLPRFAMDEDTASPAEKQIKLTPVPQQSNFAFVNQK